MSRWAVCCTAVLGFAAAPLSAQVADTSAFRQVPLPTPNQYRSAGGAPGHAYWQNRADYAHRGRARHREERGPRHGAA